MKEGEGGRKKALRAETIWRWGCEEWGSFTGSELGQTTLLEKAMSSKREKGDRVCEGRNGFRGQRFECVS